MKTVVMTGGTRGIGYGLADQLLRRQCAVVISGRDPKAVGAAASALSAAGPGDRVFGLPCDVRDVAQVQALWDAAQQRVGRIDIWINNAGVGHPQTPFWEIEPGTIARVVDTNIKGAMYGSRVAIRGMLRQGFGALYNMEGLGSDGRRVIPGLAVYSTTKAGLRFLDRALARELRGTSVIAGAIQPGMVVTDLLTKPYEGRPEAWERAKRLFNLLAEPVETVTPWLAERLLANTRDGARIVWPARRRFLLRALAWPVHRRDLFAESREP